METKTKQINGVIAILKVAAVLSIIAMHCFVKNEINYIFYGAYIYCEFLFIVIGFYFKVPKADDTVGNIVSYIKNRIERWLPWIIIETAILCIVEIAYAAGNIMETAKISFKALFDITFSGLLIRNGVWLNGTLWFLCASLWAGALIIILLSNKRLSCNAYFWGGGGYDSIWKFFV